MDNWHQYVAERYKKGEYGFDRLARETGIARTTIRRYVEKGPTDNMQVKDIPVKVQPSILQLIQKGTTIEEMMKRTGGSERVVRANIDDLREHGYLIDEVGSRVGLARINDSSINSNVEKNWNGDKIIRFGLLGDSHFGSKFVQIGYHHEAYDRFKSEGITEVYHTGDLTEGDNMRLGHAYECYVHGADQHIDELVQNYPRRDGITTSYILGNHDASFVKHVGLNIGPNISSRRPDMNYIGFGKATISLTPNCTMELRHPGGGSNAYAISYKSQRIVNSLSGGSKPNIMAFGHYHKIEYLFYRNIHVFQTGTLQAQSDFMRDGGMDAHVGYWIVEITVNDEGTITSITPRLFPYYEGVDSDWKNFR